MEGALGIPGTNASAGGGDPSKRGWESPVITACEGSGNSITCTNAGSNQGSGKVEEYTGGAWNEKTVNTWSDTAITITGTFSNPHDKVRITTYDGLVSNEYELDPPP